MNNFNNNSGWGKQKARDIAISHGLELKNPCRTGWFQLGPKAICAKLAIEKNLINEESNILTIEKDPKTCKLNKSFLTKNGLTGQIIKGKIENLNSLMEYIGQPMEYGFLDFCGEVTEELSEILPFILTNYFYDKSKVVFTFSTKIRNNLLFDYWQPGEAAGNWTDNLLLKTKYSGFQPTETGWWTLSALANMLPGGYFWWKTPYFLDEWKLPKISRIDKVFCYNDTGTPMILIAATLANSAKFNKKIKEYEMNAKELVNSFPGTKNRARLTNWKSTLTRYCNRRADETGSTPSQFKAAIKMRLTKLGRDATII